MNGNWKYNLGTAISTVGHGMITLGSGGALASGVPSGRLLPEIALVGALLNIIGDGISKLFPKPPGAP